LTKDKDFAYKELTLYIGFGIVADSFTEGILSHLLKTKPTTLTQGFQITTDPLSFQQHSMIFNLVLLAIEELQWQLH
jgi:hypothetical protein